MKISKLTSLAISEIISIYNGKVRKSDGTPALDMFFNIILYSTSFWTKEDIILACLFGSALKDGIYSYEEINLKYGIEVADISKEVSSFCEYLDRVPEAGSDEFKHFLYSKHSMQAFIIYAAHCRYEADVLQKLIDTETDIENIDYYKNMKKGYNVMMKTFLNGYIADFNEKAHVERKKIAYEIFKDF